MTLAVHHHSPALWLIIVPLLIAGVVARTRRIRRAIHAWWQDRRQR